VPGTRQKGVADSTGYDIIADAVRANFDLVLSSRSQAGEAMGLAVSIISHVLVGKTHSWRHLKNLSRWYRQQYPGFGEWQTIYEFFARKFPQELEWREATAGNRQAPLTRIG
jgi:hypothetical protein